MRIIFTLCSRHRYKMSRALSRTYKIVCVVVLYTPRLLFVFDGLYQYIFALIDPRQIIVIRLNRVVRLEVYAIVVYVFYV